MFLYFLGLVVFYYLYRWVRELPRVPDKGNKYVYVTGCDSGFGNLLARHLDKQGFRVIASCFTEKGEEDLRKACSSKLITTHLDVRSKDSVAKVAAMIKDKVGESGECRVNEHDILYRDSWFPEDHLNTLVQLPLCCVLTSKCHGQWKIN